MHTYHRVFLNALSCILFVCARVRTGVRACVCVLLCVPDSQNSTLKTSSSVKLQTSLQMYNIDEIWSPD